MKIMEKTIAKTLSGFMELLPNEQVLFNQMKEKIQKTYEKFGFLPIDTPIIESTDVLLAKAGGETEKQIYSFTKSSNRIFILNGIARLNRRGNFSISSPPK